MVRPSARLVAALFVGVALLATAAARWWAPEPPARGLVGRYYPDAEWAGAPLVEAAPEVPSAAAFARHPALADAETFGVEWQGALVVRAGGLQRFALKSDGPSWLWIGDRLVLDNSGDHAIQNVTGEIALARGVHPIRVRYIAGPERFLQLAQHGREGRLQEPGPLLPAPTSYASFRARELWPLGLVALWYTALVGVGVLALRAVAGSGALRDLGEALSDRVFVAVAVVGLAVSAAHLGYGLPAHDSWSPDELDPIYTMAGAQVGFAHWNLRWPPMHLYLLAVTLAPFDWAAGLFGLPLGDIAVTSAMFVAIRALSLATLGAALLLVFDVARQVADRRAGYFAVLFLATSPVVVHFGPLAHLEIPHLFWMTASLWAWLRVTRDPSPAGFAVFGATVGFSLATKDQAYGFYLAAPFACWWLIERSRRSLDVRRGWIAALGDRRVVVLGVATLGAFAIGHGLPWHLDRLVDHVRFMLGSEVGTFQMFDPTPAGHAALMIETIRSSVWAAGVPLTAAFLAGGVTLVRSPRDRHLLAWLIPIATYYVGFLCVILYVYDRFLIGALPVVAIVGGIGVRAILDAPALVPALRLGVPTLLVALSLTGAIAQNVAFHDDPRGAAAAWLAEHVSCGASIGVTYNPQYVPALDCYDVRPFLASHIDGMVRWPDYLVLNEAYMARLRGTPSGGRFLKQLTAGELDFALVFRARGEPRTWAPLYWEERFRNGREDSQTTLDKPLNGIEVWKRGKQP